MADRARIERKNRLKLIAKKLLIVVKKLQNSWHAKTTLIFLGFPKQSAICLPIELGKINLVAQRK